MKKEVINMKTVKMFNAIEIQKETGVDVLDIYWGSFCNDVAIPWYVHDEDDYDDDEKCGRQKIDDYLLAQGATLGEKVWIDVTW
jgi:hypothetical protein